MFTGIVEELRYMVVKGPVCINGASLTIVDKTADTFAVSRQYTTALAAE